MSVPLKDFRPGINERTHRHLARIARARGISLQELGRQILEEYVSKAVHDAKIILGQDEENADGTESDGASLEFSGTRRNGVRR